jgi:hypothetical protein
MGSGWPVRLTVERRRELWARGKATATWSSAAFGRARPADVWRSSPLAHATSRDTHRPFGPDHIPGNTAHTMPIAAGEVRRAGQSRLGR